MQQMKPSRDRVHPSAAFRTTPFDPSIANCKKSMTIHYQQMKTAFIAYKIWYMRFHDVVMI